MTHGMQAGHILPGKQALFLTLMLQRIHSLATRISLHLLSYLFQYDIDRLNLLAPTGDFIVMMCYYISAAATFSDFHSVH